MISTLLAGHPVLVRFGFGVAAVVSAGLGWWLHRTGRTPVLLVLASVSLVGTLALTLSPAYGRALVFCTVQFSNPFTGVENLANVVMMLPLTLFAALGLRRPIAVFVAVSGLSVVIELVQASVLALGRSCDTNDWLANTVGAGLGAGLALTIGAVAGRRRSSPGA